MTRTISTDTLSDDRTAGRPAEGDVVAEDTTRHGDRVRAGHLDGTEVSPRSS